MPSSQDPAEEEMDSLEIGSPQTTVFVVEDERATRSLVEGLLELEGFSVKSFPSAEAFLQEYDRLGPGCLLLDVHLPGMSGLELQDELSRRGCEIPIIVMSGEADVPTAVQALKFGAADFIEKPLNREVLLGRVRQVLQFATPVLKTSAPHLGAPTARLAALDSQGRRLQARLEEVEKALGKSRAKERAMTRRVDALMKTASELTEERRELLAEIEDARRRSAGVSSAREVASRAQLRQVEAKLSELERALAVTRAVAAEDLKQTQAEAQNEIESLRLRLRDAVETADTLRQELKENERKFENRERDAPEVETNQAESERALAGLTEEYSALKARLEAAETEADHLRSLRGDEEERTESLGGQLQEAVADIDRLRAAHNDERHRAEALDEQLQEALAARDGAAAELVTGSQPDTQQEGLLNDISIQLQQAAAVRQALEEAMGGEQSDRAAEAASLAERLAQVRDILSKRLTELTRRFEEIATPASKPLKQAEAVEPSALLSVQQPWGAEEAAHGEETIETGPPQPLTIEQEEPELKATPVRTDRVLLFDDGPLVETLNKALKTRNLRGVQVALETDGAGESGQLGPGLAFVNLGIAKAWRTVCKNRRETNGRKEPLLAYVHESSGQRGAFLARVEFAELPGDEEQLESIIKNIAPRTKRVILLAADIDRMGPIRERLRNQGISAALVFDERQLADLVAVVQPQVALLHVSSSCRDVLRCAWVLRNKDESSRIPILFLLDSDPAEDETAFLEKEVGAVSRRATCNLDKLAAAAVRELDAQAAARFG